MGRPRAPRLCKTCGLNGDSEPDIKFHGCSLCIHCFNAGQRLKYKYTNMKPDQKDRYLKKLGEWQRQCYIPHAVRRALKLSVKKPYYPREQAQKYIDAFQKLGNLDSELAVLDDDPAADRVDSSCEQIKNT